MANNYSAQGSITIKRLRSGDTLFVTLETNGIPLYQGVDPETGVPSPDWSVEANQPVITPKATSVRGNAVTLSNHIWYYNNATAPLSFTGETTGGWTKDTTGKFALQQSTGAIKIIANLASKTNIASDSLRYDGLATVAGVEYSVQKSIDILIQNTGSSSYVGFVVASTEQLTSTVANSTLTTQLQLAAQAVSEYHVKWYKDDTEWTEKVGQKTINVGRDDVDGTQLFIAEFYRSDSENEPVYRAGIRIIDTLDDFQVQCSITSTNKEVDTGKPVTVSARIVNQRTGASVSPTGAEWRMDVMDKQTWTSVKSANTNSISVSTTETDRNNEQNDVEVTAEVTWSE